VGPADADASVPMVGRRLRLTISDPWEVGGRNLLATVAAVDLRQPPRADLVLGRLLVPLWWRGKPVEYLALQARHEGQSVADLLDGREVTCNAVAVSEQDAAGPSPWGADRWRGGFGAVLTAVLVET
jgi:hypothetical protein